jgi:RNA polymerase sigma-70 factor (ECF subfamily)
MKAPAFSGWADAPSPFHPDGAGAKKFQRIFPPRASHHLKERSMLDPDEALVFQSQNGDAAAFAELVRKHQRMIHSLTYRMTGSMADAEDLAQEAFINAYRQIGAYRGGSKFSTWLYRIAMNACLSWRRRETLRVEVAANWAENNSAPRAEREVENGDLVHAALLKLPPKQRAAVMLTLHDGMSHAEAAEILNCSETTVSWRVFAAKRKLKRWLSAEEGRE